jgi:hypothetical protein
MTKQNRKVLLICLAVLVGSYIAHSVVTSATANYQRQAIRQAKPSPLSKAQSESPTSAASESPALLGNLSGIWSGRAILQGRGICNLRFELKESEPGHFSGYSTISVVNPEIFMNPKDRDVNPIAGFLKKANPASAILAGTVENGSIHFHVDKTIGDNNGCLLTSVTLTPFGTGQIAAEWQEGSCQGGNMLLQKERP